MSTSDQLKEIFAQQGGSSEKDWKRLSKSKNDDGEWVRRFENKKTGAQIDVVEKTDGSYFFQPLAPAEKNDSPIETSPEKNKAADKVIANLLDPEFEGSHDALVKKAGKALANRFTFAIIEDEGADEGSFCAMITPTAYWEKRGFCFDQPSPLWDLLPDGEDVNECGTWVFEDCNEPVALATMLIAHGFIWDKKFQNFANASLTETISAALGKTGDVKNPSPKPPTP